MDKFKWEKLVAEDLFILYDWWEQWQWPQPPTPDMLPQDAFMIYHVESEVPVYAGFLYSTGTTIGWVEFVVSNKSASVEKKRGGLQYLMDVISTIAQYKGMKSLFTSTINPSFVQSLKKCGFEVGDTGNYQLIKKI